MKQQLSTIILPLNFKVFGRFFTWVSLFLALIVMPTPPSFSNPRLPSNSSVLPFIKSSFFVAPFEETTISCKINNVIAKGVSSKEASFFYMEQAEGVFAKFLNMSLEDGDENLFALSLTDVENEKMDSCFTSNIFYGNEHKRNDQNFSNDIGSTVFMNNSSLIFEEKNGESTISRDGWIKIKSCENGKISGSFKFIIEGKISRKEVKGEFVNVKIGIE